MFVAEEVVVAVAIRLGGAAGEDVELAVIVAERRADRDPVRLAVLVRLAEKVRVAVLEPVGETDLFEELLAVRVSGADTLIEGLAEEERVTVELRDVVEEPVPVRVDVAERGAEVVAVGEWDGRIEREGHGEVEDVREVAVD